MPHDSLASKDTVRNQIPVVALTLVSSNSRHSQSIGSNALIPSSDEENVLERLEPFNDVFRLLVESPDGIRKVVILDKKVSIEKLPQILQRVCHQLHIYDAMDAIVSRTKIDGSLLEFDNNIVKVHSRIKLSEEGEEADKSESLFYDGKLILCQYCGYLSKDFTKCQRCYRKYSNCLKLYSEKFKKASDRNSSQEEKKKGQRKKKVEETECVTILSSDEEENKSAAKKSGDSSQEALFKSLSEKEPIITETTVGTDCSNMSGGGIDLSELMDSPNTENWKFDCRTVRIGSYKVVPLDKVVLTTYGLKMKVPNLKGEPANIKILRNEIVKVLVNFGVDLPVMFYYITAPAGRKIRAALHMSDKDGAVYFDPTSSEEIYKRITLLPDAICEESRLFIRSIYDHNGLLGELDGAEANEILVRAATRKDVNNQGKKSLSSASSSTSCQEIQQIMIYPPPPVKGGISINTEDYACLGEDQFLNDVIIDFYLKYLVQNILSEEDRKRTHVFSSFFYKRLTSNKNFQEINANLSPAEKRHARVKGWTKGVNLFSKDFIIIPINESSHWFLAIICFPSLQSCIRMSDNQPIEDSGRREAVGKKKNSGKMPNTIGETTITVVSQQQANATISLDPEGEERDEAEGNDEDLESNSSDDEGKENGDGNGDLMDEAFPKMPPKPAAPVPTKPTYPHQEAIKQPCILVFDSLMGASRAKVIATLREYLHVEYKVKHKGNTRDFSKNCVKGAVPKVPQQNNFIDCGLYVLQYVEEFFKNPLSDYRMPLKMQDWFQSEIVSRKRYEIQQLLHKLMDDQGVDKERLNLPRLDLRPDGRRYSEGKNDEDHMDVDEEMGEEEIEEEEEEEEEPERTDDEEDQDHDSKEQHLINVSSQVSLTPQINVPSQLGVTPQMSLNQQNMMQSQNQLHGRVRPSMNQSVVNQTRAAAPGPRTPANNKTAAAPMAVASLRPNTPARPQLVRPNVVLESRSVPSSKRSLHLPSPDVTIRKKPTLAANSNTSVLPPSSPTPKPRVSSSPSHNLQRISASVEITKKKV